jgi:hypothetical protein
MCERVEPYIIVNQALKVQAGSGIRISPFLKVDSMDSEELGFDKKPTRSAKVSFNGVDRL